MRTLSEITEDAFIEAQKAWDGWVNWLPGDAVLPRLRKAVDTASQVWKTSFAETSHHGFDVEFMDGPLRGIRKMVDHVDSFVLVVGPNESIAFPSRHVYENKRGTMQYYYVNDISLVS